MAVEEELGTYVRARRITPVNKDAWLTRWLRVRALRGDVRELDDHFRSLAANTTGNEEQAILTEWEFELRWPRNELAQLESARLRRLAYRWNVDSPSSVQDDQTGHWYIPDEPRKKLRREIRDARRESIRWWIQVVVMPLIALLSSATALISLFFRLQ